MDRGFEYHDPRLSTPDLGGRVRARRGRLSDYFRRIWHFSGLGACALLRCARDPRAARFSRRAHSSYEPSHKTCFLALTSTGEGRYSLHPVNHSLAEDDFRREAQSIPALLSRYRSDIVAE